MDNVVWFKVPGVAGFDVSNRCCCWLAAFMMGLPLLIGGRGEFSKRLIWGDRRLGYSFVGMCSDM